MARVLLLAVRGSAALAAAMLLPVARAAISDVIVWDSVRTTTQMTNTLANGYSSTTGMRLWWKFNNSDLGYDNTGHGHTGIVKGVVSGLTMTGPFGVSRTVASGFNYDNCYIVADHGYADGSTVDRTYEMWIRNPGKNGSVFFSLTQTETGGGDDLKRMWVNTDGSITIADYSPITGSQSFTSGQLTWNADQWYQIIVVYDYDATTARHNVRVYRGTRPSTLTLLFNYTSAAAATRHWLAVGGHERGYYSLGVGKAGYLGCDGTAATPTIRPEDYGAIGNGTHDDTAAWRTACAVLSAHGRGTLELTSGKTYLVGNETPGSSPAYYKADTLGVILGATRGNIIVNGNGATVRLKAGMHYGAFNPSDGTKYDGQTTDPDYAAAPGNLLFIQACSNVEVHDLTLYGDIDHQIWGGEWSNAVGDTGIQLPQSGIKLVGNAAVYLHDIQTNANGLDGIDILNDHLDENSDLQTVLIERAYSYYNGRQGLSYNCGNHLKVYDSVFAHTGTVAGKVNSPGAGVDVEPMGRYMAPGTLFDNCKFFNNHAAGLLLVGAPGVIARNCTLWGTTTYAAKVGNSTDADHLFVGCSLYGGLYTRGQRIRLENCAILNPPTADFSPNYLGAPVADRIGIEQVGGSVVASGCTIQALQASKSTSLNANAALQNCIVTHGNKHGTSGTFVAGLVNGSYLVNTKFNETSALGSLYPTEVYYVNDGNGAAKIGPGCLIEGPTAGSKHYVSWSTYTDPRPIDFDPAGLPVDIPDGVLTPNAGAGETQINTGATYTASPAFTNPADSGGRLFDKDLPYDDWNNACGINYVDQTVTVDLKATRSVRAVKLRMKNSQKPLRVFVYVGDGTTWTLMGLIRPQENIALAPWFDTTAATPLPGRYVKLAFENEGLWGWYINEVKIYGY
jgi:hypothetical protein